MIFVLYLRNSEYVTMCCIIHYLKQFCGHMIVVHFLYNRTVTDLWCKSREPRFAMHESEVLFMLYAISVAFKLCGRSCAKS